MGNALGAETWAEIDRRHVLAEARRIDPTLEPSWAHTFIRNGWTGTTVRALGDLVAWVVDQQTYLHLAAAAVVEGNRQRRTSASEAVRSVPAQIFHMLLYRANLPTGTPSGDAPSLPWLGVTAGARTQEAFAAAEPLLLSGRTAQGALADWQAFGAHGPLAWAAGLTLAEAEAQRAAGTLDIAALGALAALRGYRLPPPGTLGAPAVGA